MRENIFDSFKEYDVSIKCVKSGGETAIFNCKVCGRKRYFTSPCTSDDCEERYKNFCNGKRELYYEEESW